MKIRNGFVSNSSSSSFIVIFPEVPKSSEDVKNVLFNKGQTHFVGPYGDNDVFTIEQVADQVWNDIKEQTVNDFKNAAELLSHDGYGDPEAPEYENFKVDGKVDWEEYNKANLKYGEKKMNDFFNHRKVKLQKLNKEEVDLVFYTFEYSDNSGSFECSLEHGDLFDHLKHLRISNH